MLSLPELFPCSQPVPDSESTLPWILLTICFIILTIFIQIVDKPVLSYFSEPILLPYAIVILILFLLLHLWFNQLCTYKNWRVGLRTRSLFRLNGTHWAADLIGFFYYMPFLFVYNFDFYIEGWHLRNATVLENIYLKYPLYFLIPSSSYDVFFFKDNLPLIR